MGGWVVFSSVSLSSFYVYALTHSSCPFTLQQPSPFSSFTQQKREAYRVLGLTTGGGEGGGGGGDRGGDNELLTEEKLKAAFRTKAMECHPDRSVPPTHPPTHPSYPSLV